MRFRNKIILCLGIITVIIGIISIRTLLLSWPIMQVVSEDSAFDRSIINYDAVQQYQAGQITKEEAQVQIEQRLESLQASEKIIGWEYDDTQSTYQITLKDNHRVIFRPLTQ